MKITRFFIIFGLLALISLVCVTSGYAMAGTDPDCTDGVIESATPADGGTQWEADELLGNDNGLFFFLTWDLSNFSVAFNATNTDSTNCYVAFDLNPGESAGATADIGGVSFGGTSLPDYAIKIGSSKDVMLYTASGSNWLTGVNKTTQYDFHAGYLGNMNTELQFPKSDLGLSIGDRFHNFSVWFWVCNNAEDFIYATWPSENPTGAAVVQLGNCLFFTAHNTNQGINGTVLIEKFGYILVIMLISIPLIALVVVRRRKKD